MAENEYLDSRKARRWWAVAEAARNRFPVDDIRKLVLDRFLRTVKGICKDVPLAQWLAVVDNPSALEQLFDDVAGAHDVKALLLQAAIDGGQREQIIERFLNLGLDNCLYDIPYIAVDRERNTNLSEARRILNEARRDLVPEIRRMAGKFAQNPAWRPRRPSSKSDGVKQDPTLKMLPESLLMRGAKP